MTSLPYASTNVTLHWLHYWAADLAEEMIDRSAQQGDFSTS